MEYIEYLACAAFHGLIAEAQAIPLLREYCGGDEDDDDELFGTYVFAYTVILDCMRWAAGRNDETEKGMAA